jgi:septal ring factor EnvC (AmiA/AmiB activator)
VLAGQLRSAYLLSRQGRLQLWLSQDDPSMVARTMAYFDFIGQARAGRIREIAGQLERLASLREESSAAFERLAALEREAGAERELRIAARDQRREALALLDADIRSRGGELVALKEQQAMLEALLLELQEAFSDIPDELAGRDFSGLTGRLAWPVEGRVAAAPGRPKPGLQSWGAIIASDAGMPVRAIAPGRIAYADWLRGFGLLTIIDHGEGFLSLYAFNESLVRDVGDWVATGEDIAVVGASGGRETPGLYFELRHNGKPVDPRPWFTTPAPETDG